MISALILASALSFVETKDAIDDTKTVAAVALDGDTMLAIGCNDGQKMSARLVTKDWLHMPSPLVGWVDYMVRIDKSEAFRIVWIVDDRHHAHIDGDSWTAKLIGPMLEGGTLRLRAVGMGEGNIDYSFEISDSREVLTKVFSRCESAKIRQKINAAGYTVR